MRNFLLLIFINTSIIYSQEYQSKIDSIKTKLSSIDSIISNLKKEKKELNGIIIKLNKEISKFKYDSVAKIGFKTFVNSFDGTNLLDKPRGNIITSINKDSEIIVYDEFTSPSYLKASYNGMIGYISYAFIKVTPEIREIINRAKSSSIDERLKNNPKLARLTKRFGYERAKRIIKKEYWLGMSWQMARESLGSPIEINRSVHTWGTTEQWIYEKRGKRIYLYFEDGSLNSIQD